MDLTCEEALYGGSVGSGKGLPPDAGVLTPWGFKAIGRIKVGDMLCAVDGTQTKVILVSHRGVQPRYRLTWHNGEETVCDNDHIWLGWITGKSRKQANKPTHSKHSARKWTTEEIATRYRKQSKGRFAIPAISEPVRFNVHGENHGPRKHVSRTLDPYVLGSLLGDGQLGKSIKLHSADPEIIAHVSKALGRKVKAYPYCSNDPCPAYPVQECAAGIDDLGLRGHRSWEKFIPRIYKLATIEERWALLQGLMDTDGWIEQDGNCYFCSTSKTLRDDVSEIAQSLGAITFPREGDKTYTYLGKKKRGRRAYTVYIKMPDSRRMFRLNRKRELAGREPQSMALFLESIERIEDGPTVCIQVAHPSSLFITDGFVVTHNTEVLLRWLEQGIQYPGFSGLFIRRTMPQLTGSPTTPIERSYRFFARHKGIYNAQKKVWTFPNGAMIRFGSMQYENDKHNYDGPEFVRICVDQCEQLTETQYTYLFSRMRRLKNYPIPCGMRAAANPVGGLWVKRRFISDEAIQRLRGFNARDPSPPGMMFEADNGAIFLPARVADNPSIEVEEYIVRLQSKLGASLAARLANGDWSVVEGAIINAEHLRYYNLRGNAIEPLNADGVPLNPDRPAMAQSGHVQRFATIDTAGTTKQRAAEAKGRPASWSVCAIWDYEPQRHFLYLRHIWRERVGWVDLVKGLRGVLRDWAVTTAIVEDAHFGRAVYDELRNERWNMALSPVVMEGQKETRGESAKHERAIGSGLLGMIANADVYLPNIETVAGVAKWLPDFEQELLGWTGMPNEVADQIDVCSHAAYHCKRATQSWGGVIR